MTRRKLVKNEPKTCKLVLCEDPATGKLVMRPDGECPEGYIQRMAKKLGEQDEIKFMVPKKITVEKE